MPRSLPDQVLEMTEAPASILICDAGYIEVEMAFLMNTFGSKVMLATESPRILPMEDHDTSQRIAQALRENGVEVLTRHSLKSVSRSDSGAGWLCVLSGAKERTVEVRKILVAGENRQWPTWGFTGRNRFERGRRHQGQNRLETSVQGIYAIGDATAGGC